MARYLSGNWSYWSLNDQFFYLNSSLNKAFCGYFSDCPELFPISVTVMHSIWILEPARFFFFLNLEIQVITNNTHGQDLLSCQSTKGSTDVWKYGSWFCVAKVEDLVEHSTYGWLLQRVGKKPDVQRSKRLEPASASCFARWPSFNFKRGVIFFCLQRKAYES